MGEIEKLEGWDREAGIDWKEWPEWAEKTLTLNQPISIHYRCIIYNNLEVYRGNHFSA
jgi:hypothetical protein